MWAHNPHASCILVAVGGKHATFPGCEGLRSVKAKRSQFAYAPDSPPFIFSRKSMCSIFDNVEPASASDFSKFVHVTGLARHMHGDNGACAGRNRSFNG